MNNFSLVRMRLKKDDKEAPDDFVFMVVGTLPRFVEGKEYVLVKRFETDKTANFMLRESLIKIQ